MRPATPLGILLLIGLGTMLCSAQRGPSPSMVSGDPIDNLLAAVRVDAAQHYKNLTIYPIVARRPLPASGYRLLEDALRSHDVVVREKDGGEVNTVMLRNKGDHYVFGLSGEIVSGARQDRMLQSDILIPPHSGWLAVAVFCTEHGRWQGASLDFESKGYAVGGTVRKQAALTADQSEVWAAVSRSQEALGVSAPTGAFARVYETPAVQDRAQPYVESFGTMPKRVSSMVGAVVTVGDEILCLDLFGSPDLCAQLWPKLLRSYVIDALSRKDNGEVHNQDAAAFLDQLRSLDRSSLSTPGLGRLFELEGPLAKGQALTYRRAVVHLDLFPALDAGVDGDDDDSPYRLDSRRQRSTE